MTSGCCSFGSTSLIILCLWICCCDPTVRISTTEPYIRVQLYAYALLPVNNDGLGDYVRNAMLSSTFQPWLRQKQPQQPDIAFTTNTKTVIRIKRTEASQLSDIATFLATSSQQSCMQESQISNSWKNRIDLLFAKSDIEALIRRRCRILHLGQTASARTKKQLQQQQQQQQEEANVRIDRNKQLQPRKPLIQCDDDAILKYLWSTNDELRTEIQKAASETGEDIVWKHHNPMIITPSSTQWFNHIQISAVAASIENVPAMARSMTSAFNFPFNFQTESGNDSFSKVVGFCEVAMLSNPMYAMEDDGNNPNKKNCVISIHDTTQQRSDGTPQINYYSPAIANLAVDHTMRRRGIATKLLQRAERYISRYWMNTTTIGLYVSTSNLPAIRLYEKCGYEKQMTVSSDSSSSSAVNNEANRSPDNVGTMWYMSKEI